MSDFDGFDWLDTDFDGFEEEGEEEEEYFYKIGGFSGESKFWRSTHYLSPIYKVLQTMLVPFKGEATELGEPIRIVSNLVYDIFNNGLCNDKIAECKYLLNWFRPNDRIYKLKNVNSINIVKKLLDCQELDYMIDLDQDSCDQLDDVMEAIIKVTLYELSK